MSTKDKHRSNENSPFYQKKHLLVCVERCLTWPFISAISIAKRIYIYLFLIESFSSFCFQAGWRPSEELLNLLNIIYDLYPEFTSILIFLCVRNAFSIWYRTVTFIFSNIFFGSAVLLSVRKILKLK